MSVKHIDLTVKAPAAARKRQTTLLPSWYGTAAGAIRALADDPHALDHVGTIDMDAVYRKADES